MDQMAPLQIPQTRMSASLKLPDGAYSEVFYASPAPNVVGKRVRIGPEPWTWVTDARTLIPYETRRLLQNYPVVQAEATHSGWPPAQFRDEERARAWWDAEVTRLLRAGWTLHYAPEGAAPGPSVLLHDDGTGTLRGTAGRGQGELGSWDVDHYRVTPAVAAVTSLLTV